MPARARLRSPQFRGGAVIFGPVVRSHGYDLKKKVRKLGLKTALSAKQAEGKLVVLDAAELADGQDQGAGASSFGKLGWTSVLVIDGAAVDENFAARRAQPAAGRRAAAAGRQRLRHPAPRHAGADPRRGRAAGGAAEMSAEKHDRRPRSRAVAARADVRASSCRPVITEKATHGSRAQPGHLPRALDATKPEIKAAVEGLFNVKVQAVNTLSSKGKTKRFRAASASAPTARRRS